MPVLDRANNITINYGEYDILGSHIVQMYISMYHLYGTECDTLAESDVNDLLLDTTTRLHYSLHSAFQTT
jgi:hypothetical protein